MPIKKMITEVFLIIFISDIVLYMVAILTRNKGNG